MDDPDIRISPTTRRALVCIPSSDRGLAVLAHLRLREVDEPSQLEEVLRPVYPKVRVQRRELSGAPIETWYVYRDGNFQSTVTVCREP